MSSNDITFLEECFAHDGRSYNYCDVAHLSWYATHTNVSMNSLPAGSHDDATLKIIFRTSDVLKLKAGALLFPTLRDTAGMCRRLSDTYKTLAQKTGQVRLDGYMRQLREKEYFTYSGYRFYRDGTLTKGHNSTKIGSLHEVSLVRATPFELIIKQSTQSIFDRIKSRILEQRINLQVDYDVFHFLLEEVFHKKVPESAWMR